MSKPLAALGAAAAGALAMYYLDPELGAQRRRLLADLVRTGLPGEAGARGRRPRPASAQAAAGDPHNDAQLRDRVQDKLGRIACHPRAIQVSVDHGVVRLTGRVLAQERDALLQQVQQIPGVHKVVNAMTAHDISGELAGVQAQRPLAATGA